MWWIIAAAVTVAMSGLGVALFFGLDELAERRRVKRRKGVRLYET